MKGRCTKCWKDKPCPGAYAQSEDEMSGDETSGEEISGEELSGDENSVNK